ncbi:MAG: M3 family metallopeptidase, partial [Actinobacteria bacterium]|nr:M3 family metallopeptidase [Actinomycetota bacterium]
CSSKINYGSKYYSYLWSKIFALDLFDEIKKDGLFNKETGKKYIDSILSKGGSAEPQELINKFLGRESSTDAFFKDMHIAK